MTAEIDAGGLIDTLDSCLESFWCSTSDGSDNRLLADAAIDAAKAIRAYLASTSASEAEPVAWQRRHRYEPNGPGSSGVWTQCPASEATGQFERNPRYEYRPLYAAPLPTPASDGQVEAVRDVLAERKRQVDVEHWMPGHDDQHTGGELAQAAAAYAYYGTEAENSQPPAESIFPTTWDMSWWKPGDHRRNLVKAGALIIAEIERLDRLAAMGSTKP